MDPHEVFLGVVIQIKQLESLPIFQRTQYILLGVIELVRNIGYAGSLPGAHHAEQVEIDL